ncbi:hypothetical protein RCL_jg22908.t1 [Rhizophagus clarus]|uniref:Uncharacterized protein n=1 Tax=Rhizophagus clarus TaxID=94130 RepID=A0A8H3LFE4_9GLOM|nr:hypothetical protein RCL_jg22908.t1 [Rhizophagus clarus]
MVQRVEGLIILTNFEVQNAKGLKAKFWKLNPEHQTCGLGLYFKGRTKFRTPLEADYDISKVWNSLEADQYFKDPELFRGGPVFQRSGIL